MENFSFSDFMAFANKQADYSKNKKKYTDKKVLAVYLLRTLQLYSSKEFPLSYDEMIDYLESGVDGFKYNFAGSKRDSNLKKIKRVIDSLILAGNDIKKEKNKYWLEQDMQSHILEDVDKNATTCFDALMRCQYIDNDFTRMTTIIECLDKFNQEKNRANNFHSVMLDSITPVNLDNIFEIFKYIGKRNIKFSYPSEDYNYHSYKVSPYEIVFYDKYYYLVCKVYSNTKEITQLKHFRADLIEDIVPSKKTKFSPISSLHKYNEISQDVIDEPRLFQFARITEKDELSEYILYKYICDNIIGDMTTAEFVVTNPFVIREEDIINKFGDRVKVNRKTHTFTTQPVPRKVFIDWAIANYNNIQVKTPDVMQSIEKRLEQMLLIRKVERETNFETNYSVALNIKNVKFNYRMFGILGGRNGKQIVLKCTKQNLAKLQSYIKQKPKDVSSDNSNINRNEISRQFHFGDL